MSKENQILKVKKVIISLMNNPMVTDTHNTSMGDKNRPARLNHAALMVHGNRVQIVEMYEGYPYYSLNPLLLAPDGSVFLSTWATGFTVTNGRGNIHEQIEAWNNQPDSYFPFGKPKLFWIDLSEARKIGFSVEHDLSVLYGFDPFEISVSVN